MMKHHHRVLVAVLVATTTTGAGFWLGRQWPAPADPPGQDPQSFTDNGSASERKILYYRNPMGLPDISMEPKKDSMGMDYIPVYEGDDGQDGGVSIDTARVQRSGVRFASAQWRELDQTVRTVGVVAVDEARQWVVAPRFGGWIERLYVNTTGTTVQAGQPLFEVYSPELVSAQREYQVAVRGLERLARAGPEARERMVRMAESALERLRNWQVSETEIAALAAGAEPREHIRYRATGHGVVLELEAVEGMRFSPGQKLFGIADLSTVWVMAQVYERDLPLLRPKAPATVRFAALPGQMFDARVDYIYPTVDPATRTVPVRLRLANARGMLRPDMYAEVTIAAGPDKEVLTIPASAVLDDGVRQRVLLDRGEGRFEPRQLRLGLRGDEFVQVLDGLQAGDRVVVAAQFLIDSEANLQAALQAMTDAEDPAPVHEAVGILEEIDAGSGRVLITHEPVPGLNWPEMTMEFVPERPELFEGLAQGSRLRFSFREGEPGEWRVVAVDAQQP